MITFIAIFWAIAAITVFVMSKPHNLFFGLMSVIMLGVFGAAFTNLIIQDIIIPVYNFKKNNLKKKQKKYDSPGSLPLSILKTAGICLQIIGLGSFMNGFWASAGINPWTGEKTEIPLTMVGNYTVDKESRLYCTLNFYSRIQEYDGSGNFTRGWFINSGGGRLCLKIDEENRLIVANIKLHKLLTFNSDGKMIKEEKLEGNEYENWYSEDEHGENIVKTIQSKIPLYQWLLFGPQCWLLAVTGLLIAWFTDKKMGKVKKS